jgi:sigma-54 dependent transcriptional regulator, acetoin dehydrogenase operon transcriptional activator AcoR
VRELNSVLMQATFLADGNEIKAEDLNFEIEYEQDKPFLQEERIPSPLLFIQRKRSFEER